ncbi:MAG: sugar-binding transcriptional regulator [Anaerolineae bacterium]|nr:sugar-binding transcriptional regulator [Anaerolineae bacterium]
MSRLDELRLMTAVARLYHEQGLGQIEIANQLSLSQSTVSRLLKRAQQEKIVRTTVSVPSGVYPHLEDQLQTKYQLQQAIVADCSGDTEEATRREIGAAAAYYLETTLKQGEVVGISSWSETLLAMVDAMHPLPRQTEAQVVQILGGVGNPAAEAHAARLTGRLADLIHGRVTPLPAPGVVGSANSMRVLLEDQFVGKALGLFDRVTLALVGIGAVEPSKLLASSGNIFSPQELEMLRQVNAVGDICLRFFDAAGKPVHTPLDKRVIGMNLEQLQKVKRAVGIAGGERKFAAIKGALKGHWINILITDRYTAERLIAEVD